MRASGSSTVNGQTVTDGARFGPCSCVQSSPNGVPSSFDLSIGQDAHWHDRAYEGIEAGERAFSSAAASETP